MKNLIIFGTGDFAIECYYWLLDMILDSKDYTFKGFVSTNNDLNPTSNLNDYYLGNEITYNFNQNDYVVVAIAGNLKIKEKIINFLNEKNVNYFNLIHPTAIIKTQNIGVGNIFAPYTVISFESIINNHNSFNCYTSFGHHAKIGNFNALNSHTDITGHCEIGDSNFFGSSAIMLPKSKIGNNNKVAAGSVIYKRFRNDITIIGNPAVKLN